MQSDFKLGKLFSRKKYRVGHNNWSAYISLLDLDLWNCSNMIWRNISKLIIVALIVWLQWKRAEISGSQHFWNFSKSLNSFLSGNIINQH